MKKEIYQIALDFRTAILKAKQNREFSGDGLIEFFPRGNCGIICDLLGRYYVESGNIKCWYTSGEFNSESHVWITLEDKNIVDITGDQYIDRLGLLHYSLPIYVGKMDSFHSLFKLNRKPIEITPSDWIPDILGESEIQRKKGRHTR